MKALSVRQPWASMIAWGEKTIEVRTWSTKYRGPLLIVAGKKNSFKNCCDEFKTLPHGVALCIVDLIDVRRYSSGDAKKAVCGIESNEWCWVLTNTRPVDPFEIKGRPGLFEVEF